MIGERILVRGSVMETARSAANVALKGLPAIRAALWGARIGAGALFDRAVVGRLGIEVAEELPAVATVGARSAMVLGRDGVAVRLTKGAGVAAVVTEGSVGAIATSTTRSAFFGLAKAARQGAVAGALIDGGFGVFEAVRGMRANQLTRRGAAMLVGKRAARGAVAGGAGVAAAGAASALIAVTGISLVGAPIVFPLVTMAAVGLAASHGFDRLFPDAKGPTPQDSVSPIHRIEDAGVSRAG